MKKLAFLPLVLMSTLSVAQTKEFTSRNNKASACEVIITPNPSYGTIQVNAPEGSKCIVSSAKGTYIGTWNVGKTGFRLEGLSTGMYVVMIKNGMDTVTRKFIVL